MVCGPASRPWASSSERRFTTSSATSSGVLVGEVLGRRDRASNAAGPSARHRAMSLETCPLDTPNRLAAWAWVMPSTTTDMMIARRFDTPYNHPHHHQPEFPMSRDIGFQCPEPPHHTFRQF